MKKTLAPLAVVAVLLALAGVLYVRTDNAVPRQPTVGGEVEEALTETAYPAVLFAIVPRDGESTMWSYHVPSGITEGPIEAWEGAPISRFGSGSNLCGMQGYATETFALECETDADGGTLRLTVTDPSEDNRVLVSTSVAMSELGLAPSAATGYLAPVAVSDDHTTIYLGRRVETESYVAGLWKLDVATGAVNEISYVREHDMYQYDINTAAKELVGVTFAPPESLGESPKGPSEIYLVDLVTGIGQAVDGMAKDVFENPMFSPDTSLYAFYESGVTIGAGRTMVLTKEFGRTTEGWTIDGVAKDWLGDTLVVDRDGNLFLYDLTTETETQITHETDAYVEYLGTVK